MPEKKKKDEKPETAVETDSAKEETTELTEGLSRSIVDKILERNQPPAGNDEKNESAAEDQNEGGEEETDIPVITAEMAEEFSWAKSFTGKPVTEVMKAYDNLIREFTRKSQELSELKKTRVDEPAEKDAAKSDADEGSRNNADTDKTPENMKKEILNSLTPLLVPVVKFGIENQVKRITEDISARLPEEVDVKQLLNSWKENNTDFLEFFLQHPDKLVENVVQYYKAGNYDLLQQDTRKKLGDEVLKKTSEALKGSTKKKAVESPHRYVSAEDDSELSPTVKTILRRHGVKA